MTYRLVKRRKTQRARRRVVQAARKKGYINASVAKRIGNWRQHWYHMAMLEERGHLRKTSYDRWEPAKRGRPTEKLSAY